MYHTDIRASAHDNRSSLARYNLGRIGAGIYAPNLLVDLFLKRHTQVLGRLVDDSFREETTIIFPSETITVAVEYEDGIDFGEERSECLGKAESRSVGRWMEQ